MQSIRWGIIGCGDVTEVKSGPGFQRAAGSELVAVMRRDGARAADYAARHGVGTWYDDAQKLIDDPRVDAVYIATPPGMHETYAMQVCAAGKPCYVEKPMARNANEARRMSEAFARRSVPLFVAYYRRAMPRFVKVKELISSGALGALRSVSYSYRDGQMARRQEPVPWRLEAEHAGGGLFLDLGSHVLDLLDFLLGPFDQVKGNARSAGGKYDVEDHVDLEFKAAMNVKGQVEFDFISDSRHEEFRFEGDRGSLSFSCFGVEPLVLQLAGQASQSIEPPTPAHVQQPLIQAIVNVLHGDQSPLAWLSTGPVALRTQAVMDEALRQYYGGREDGFWNRGRGE